MMLLESEMVQVGTGALLSVNTLLLLKLFFNVGRYAQKLDDHERRITHTEEHVEACACPHVACPLRKGLQIG